MHHLNRQFKKPQMQTFHVRRSIKISKTIAGKKEKHAWLSLQPSYDFAEKKFSRGRWTRRSGRTIEHE